MVEKANTYENRLSQRTYLQSVALPCIEEVTLRRVETKRDDIFCEKQKF